MTDDLWRLTASQAVDLLRKGEVSSAELIDAAEARHGAVDSAVNAVPITCFDRARGKAADLSADSLLAGLPVVIKDYNDVEGLRTTRGSPLFADHIATRSDYLVERLEDRGAVVVGKSNVPEFAGANTFNPVFGATRNPWDTRLTAGGSSGGAAVAVATGMAWLAHGNDLGGSLRTPAGFNAVAGLRPSPGRVPRGPAPLPFDNLWVEGPIARTVTDLALFLDALSGHHPGDPISLAAPRTSFREAVMVDTAPVRVGWSPDLGMCTVDPEIVAICAEAAAGFAALGSDVVEACPDFTDAFESFMTLRALFMANWMTPLLATNRADIKPDIVWNVEKGQNLTTAEIGRAERARGALVHRVAAFFGDHDILACPVTQCPPFPVDQNYIDTIAGQKLNSYVDWISITFAITLTGCPALTVPCGFTKDGLPVGLQLVGKPRGEARLLAAGRQLEEMMGIAGRLPIDPRVRH